VTKSNGEGRGGQLLKVRGGKGKRSVSMSSSYEEHGRGPEADLVPVASALESYERAKELILEKQSQTTKRSSNRATVAELLGRVNLLTTTVLNCRLFEGGSHA